MERIVVASRNPVKIKATLDGFRRMFPNREFEIHAISASSGVSSQPLSDARTLQGAQNRARNASQQVPEADYWVGIEGGIEGSIQKHCEGSMAAFAWIVITSRGRVGQARTATFFLPDAVAELVRQGQELGQADDIVFDRTNSKRQEGAVGLLTGNVIDRTQLYAHAVVLALIPFRHPDHYGASTLLD